MQACNDSYCVQCGLHTSKENTCENLGHDRLVLNLEGPVSDDSLSSLLVSLFAAYQSRPCLGIPSGSLVEWNWLSYTELKGHIVACILYLQDCQAKFLVAAFEYDRSSVNCLELIAFDLAAALLGRCSVIAQGKDHAHSLSAVLGEENCKIVYRLPAVPSTMQTNLEFWNHLFWDKRDEDVLFSLFATSGSVGHPKLVRRTRSSWLETVKDTIQFSNQLCITLNFTSLAHSAARTELWWNLACGGQTALADGQLKFLDSLEKLSPTEIAAPPAVWAEIRSDLTSRGINDFAALKCKMERLLRNLHTVLTGTAPCEGGLFDFLRGLFGSGDIAVFNHYGATEIGSIALDGKVNQDLKVKLLEIPEQGIHSPQGELCIYLDPENPNGSVFEGYYFDDHCKEAMTDDGYYRTGDIAEWIGDSAKGEIQIVGRVSSIVKLSNGKFESLESMDIQVLQALQVELPSVKQVCTLEFGGALVAVVCALGDDLKLPKLPVPCIFSKEPFTVQNGMLTPSLKLCRRRVLATYQHALRKLVGTQGIRTDLANYDKDDKVTELLAAINPKYPKYGMDSFDESRTLRDLGVTSVHFARIASILNIPVYLLAESLTLRDVRCISSDGVSGLGVRAAEADIQFCMNQWNQWNTLNTWRSLQLVTPSLESTWKVVVVTGATGHVGSCFVDLLLKKGLKVICIARSLGHDVTKPQCGMNDEDYSRCVLADAVIHCAACVNWNAAYSDLREINVLSLVNIAKLCVESKLKTLLFIGSGITFPEEAPDLSWLQECANPYMVSKVASEFLIRKLHQQTVVVRAGMIVWHSNTGAHNPSDAYVRLLQSIKRDSLAWQRDDFMDGMNVDAFCKAACSLFESRTFDTYNLCGNYTLSTVFRLFQHLPKKVPYDQWYQTMTQHSANDHPLTALLPHIPAEGPPFVAACESSEIAKYLTTKCARALGSELAQQVVKVTGYEAFAEALRHSENARSLQGHRYFAHFHKRKRFIKSLDLP